MHATRVQKAGDLDWIPQSTIYSRKDELNDSMFIEYYTTMKMNTFLLYNNRESHKYKINKARNKRV